MHGILSSATPANDHHTSTTMTNSDIPPELFQIWMAAGNRGELIVGHINRDLEKRGLPPRGMIRETDVFTPDGERLRIVSIHLDEEDQAGIRRFDKYILPAMEEAIVRLAMVKCAQCGQRPAVLLRCGRCRTTRYCDALCQRQHWNAGHKQECEIANE